MSATEENENEQWKQRFILLWQEGLVCTLCSASELQAADEIQTSVCDDCSSSLSAMHAIEGDVWTC